MDKSKPILIIGAGVFGLSTALELSKRGYTDITVFDRYLAPVPDGSSVDISRVIRMDYADPVYAAMANKALSKWETEYRQFYNACGFILAAQRSQHPYIEKCKDGLWGTNQTFMEIDGSRDYDIPHNHVSLKGLSGFYNATAGWVDAAGAITYLAQLCSLAGVSFVTGPRGTVVSLLRRGRGGGTVEGVQVQSGTKIYASRVILATGAWSSSLLNFSGRAVSTSQPVGFIQLTPEEASKLQNHPIVMNLSTGVFCFPPTSDNILKLAQHGHGYETRYSVNWNQDSSDDSNKRLASSPPRKFNNTPEGYIPSDASAVLREGLKLLFPQFASRPWLRTRLCWYTDTPQGDFICDHHPELKGVFLATGGSAHAFKFLPVLGQYVADCFEGIAPPELKQKWSFQASTSVILNGDGSRGGSKRRVLNLEEQAKL